MKMYLIVAVALCCWFTEGQTQQKFKTEKVIFISYDGLRWQDLFYGADSAMLFGDIYIKERALVEGKYWHPDYKERRRLLSPFIWDEAVKVGSFYGNRKFGSHVNLTNPYWFSYPGYNELYTGITGDTVIYSNNKIPNPNVTVLEMVNNDMRYRGRVAMFGSWELFPEIVNRERSGVYVNAGFEPYTVHENERIVLLNELLAQVPSPWATVRLDAFTHHFAFEHLKNFKPSLLVIAYGETDDFGHDARYDHYLNSANTTDRFIRQLYEWTQQDPDYKDKTTFIITTDHGRGTHDADAWRSHGVKYPESDHTWFIIISPDLPALGEIKEPGKYYNDQFAPSLTYLLGVPFKQKKMSGLPFHFLSR